MVFFAGGSSAGGSGNPNTRQPKSSTLSPLAPPFTIRPNPNRTDQGFSNLNGELGEKQGFVRDPVIASSSTEYYLFPSLPQVAVSEGCRAYGSDSNLWQGKHVNSSMRNLPYGSDSQCIDWYSAEIPKFVTDDYFSGPCNFSEGSVGVPSSVLKDVPLRGIPITQLPDPISMKESSNPFVADAIYKFSKEDAYTGSESLVRAPTSLHKGMPYSNVFDSVSLESSNTFDSKSSYDSNIQGLDCFTTDLAYYYPAMTCSTSFQFSPPSACGTNSLMTFSMLEDKTSPSEDLYGTNADYAINVPVMLKETRIDQNLEAKEDYDESRRMLDMWKCPGISSFGVGHEAAEKKSITIPAEVNSGVETIHLDLSNTFTSGFNLTVPVDESTKDSSGTLDQTVDSPCWKGATVSQQSPFGSLQPGFVPYMEVESKEQADMDKCGRHLSVAAGCSESLSAAEKFKKEVICNEEMENPLVYNSKESSSVSILPNNRQICGDIYKICQTRAKEIQHSAICEGQNIEVTSDKERIPDEKDSEATLLNQESVSSSSEPIQASSVSNYESSSVCVLKGSSSKCQPPAIDLAAPYNIVEQLVGSSLLKNAPLSVVLGALRYISEMLLSSNNFTVGELNENDHELLQLVINNLRAFSIKNKQDSSNGSAEVAHPNISHDTKGNMHSVSSGAKNNELDNMAFDHGASCADKDQDVSRIVGKNYCEEERNVQALVYKKLWVDAEAALCSMKYEFEVAQMKSETDNLNNQTQGNIQPLITRLKAHPMEQDDEFRSKVKLLKEDSSVFGSAATRHDSCTPSGVGLQQYTGKQVLSASRGYSSSSSEWEHVIMEEFN